MEIHQHELSHLAQSQCTFPPDFVFHMQRDKVIGVHNSVNQSVQNYSEIHITIVANIQVQPIEQKNAEMMIDVQEGQLLPTLLSNDEESIHEIQNLGQIENIKHKPYRRILVVKHLAWNDTVASLPSLQESTPEIHP